MVVRAILLISLLLPVASASAALQRYVASEHDSNWQANSSKLRCELSHEIPVYGKAVFEQTAGGQFGLSLSVKHKPYKVGQARLISAAPSWKHDVRERDLGQVNYKVDSTAFKLPQVVSRRVLLELQQGMFPTLTYQDWADGRDEVEVALSAVNLRDPLREFVDCMAGVLPYSYEDVRSSSFTYRSGQIQLDDKEKNRLDQLATYLKADTSVKKVTIGAHTDSRGYRTINKQVSQRRAEAVRNHLIKQGVSARLFTIRAFGESRPTASNRTKRGRELNRRVEVTLLK